MERIAIAMQDGGAGAGARAASQPHFVLPPNLYNEPPGRGDFLVSNFIQASSPREIWRKTIFGGEGGCWRGNGVACFGPPPWEKIFGGVIAIISFRPGGRMQQSAVPRCAILSVPSYGRHWQ